MQANPDYLRLRLGDCSLWISRDAYDAAAIEVLADPDRLFSLPGAEIVKDQKKIKVARISGSVVGKTANVYLKRYNAFSWRYRLFSILRSSAAWRAWRGAAILIENGFRTGRPVAAVECRSWGMLTKSFYISEEIPMGETIDDYWRRELAAWGRHEGFFRRRKFLRDLALLFRSLHQAKVYHNDLKDANILFSACKNGAQESFHLLDLEGVRLYRYLSNGRRIKNLVQLNRTMGKLLQRTQKLYWLRAYLGPFANDEREKRWWIKKVLKRSVRGDLRSMRKESPVSIGPGL